MSDLWNRFKTWLFGESAVEEVKEPVETVISPGDWGSAEFEVLDDKCNKECRVVDVKLTGKICGESHEMVQRAVFPVAILGEKENYDKLAEVLSDNILYPWVDGIIKKRDDVEAEEVAPVV